MKSVFSLLVCKAKSLELKVISIAWGMEVSPHAAKTASSERWQDNRNFQPKMPEHHLAICFLLKLCDSLFVCWAFVKDAVLLFGSLPGRLKSPTIQANGLESRALWYANRRISQCFCFNRFVVFSDHSHTVNLWAVRHTPEIDLRVEKKSTFTPKIVTWL